MHLGDDLIDWLASVVERLDVSPAPGAPIRVRRLRDLRREQDAFHSKLSSVLYARDLHRRFAGTRWEGKRRVAEDAYVRASRRYLAVYSAASGELRSDLNATQGQTALFRACDDRTADCPAETLGALFAFIDSTSSASDALEAWMRAPAALVALEGYEEAVELVRRLTTAMPSWTPRWAGVEGDVLASGGETIVARAAYEFGREAAVREETTRYERELLALRLRLLGARAPDLSVEDWVGGRERPLSALRGSVVVFVLFKSKIRDSLRVLVQLDDLRRAHAAADLHVFGVTQIRGSCHVPLSREVHDGEWLTRLSREEFGEQTARVRSRLELTYPLGVATRHQLASYVVEERWLPTTVVIDRSGTVAFVTGRRDPGVLVRRAVGRLLAEAT